MRNNNHFLAKLLELFSKPMFLLFLLVLVSLGSGYVYMEYSKTQQELMALKGGSPEVAEKEKAELVKKVGMIAELPQEDSPTVATVTDIESVKDQQFFSNAQNGDKVLIYTKSKRAFLYRPSTNKIIEVAPINLSENTNTEVAGASTAKTEPELVSVKLSMYNGTAITDINQTIFGKISSEVANYKFELLDNAIAQLSYEETLVVVLNNSFANLGQEIATKLNAKISTLPSGEQAPLGDILIIVGRNSIQQ